METWAWTEVEGLTNSSMGSTVFLFLALVCEVAFVLIGGKEEDRWAVSMRQLTARRKLREAGLPK